MYGAARLCQVVVLNSAIVAVLATNAEALLMLEEKEKLGEAVDHSGTQV